jgi:UPF0716 protein FxsA
MSSFAPTLGLNDEHTINKISKDMAKFFGYATLLAFVLFTGFLGVSLAKYQGREYLKKLQEELGAGRIPANPIIEGLMILVSAAVLITPGFITDIIGFLLLVPAVRRFFAPKLVGFFKPKASGKSFFYYKGPGFSSQGPDATPQNSDFFDMPEDDGASDRRIE